MAKKKKHKKHQFKAATTSTPSMSENQSPKASVPSSATPAATQPSTTMTSLVPDLPLIMNDIRMVVVLALGFIVFELIIWYVLGHTALGPQINQLIKL